MDEIRKDGVSLKLEPRTMRLLVCLAERAGQVVSVDELLDLVWKDVVVSPDSVYSVVASLRRTLGDDPKDPTYIANVMRRGYRLVAPVSTWVDPLAPQPTMGPPVHSADSVRLTEGSPESHPQQPSFLASGPATVRQPLRRLAAAILALAMIAMALGYIVAEQFWKSERNNTTARQSTPPPPISDASVAVLPFVDMSERRDQEYFSDGLSEELIELLSKIPDLRVPARTSSFYFKGRAEKLETIAAELRVANVLEGSVRKAGNKLRVTAQLIRADTNAHLWSETYDRNVRDVFRIQDEIAGAVVSALKVKLAPGNEATNSHRTSNPEAHNQYLLGRQFLERGNVDTFQRAAQAYRKAIELDPRYAAAYAELAVAESYLADQTGDEAEQQQALAAADKAVELAPDEADVYAARGYLRVRRWNLNGAQADFEKALTYDSANSTLQWRYATLLDALGRLPEAIAAAKKATELDPLSSFAWAFFGMYLIENRQFAAAHEAVRRALEIQPDSAPVQSLIGDLQMFGGHATEALATYRKIADEGLHLAGVAWAEHALGHAKQSRQAIDEAVARLAQSSPIEIAEIYASCGDKDKAFEWLERAYRRRDPGLYFMRNDIYLASLRGDARFAAMLRRIGLSE